MFCRFQPQGIILLKRQPFVGKLAKFSIDHIPVIERLLTVPVVEGNTESLEVFLYPVENVFDTKIRASLDGRVFFQLCNARIF